jgi:cell division protein FtsZ
MGTAIADGDDRALSAAKQALLSPLLADNDIKGAKKILLNIASGKKEITMDETSEITDHIRDEAGDDADLIFGCSRDETLGDAISVTIIATAFETQEEKDRKDLPFEIEDTLHAPVETIDEPVVETKQEEPKIIHTLNVEPSLPFEFDGDSGNEDPVAVGQEIRVGLGVERDGTRLEPKKKELNLMELESTPAYIRKARKLESVDHSSTTNISRLTLQTDEEKRPEIRNNNRFLHDNVD